MGAAVRFKQLNVPRQQGEQARLKVVQGPDYGAVYVITGTTSTLGRGEDNDIVISDLKASRKHGEFWAGPNGWQVKDLGSANGLMHNGKPTRLAKISSGDIVTFGETTLEFTASAEAGTLMLVAPPRELGVIQAERQALDERKKKARKFGVDAAKSNEPAKPLYKDTRSMLYMALGGVALWLMMTDSSDTTTQQKKGKVRNTENLRQYLPGDELDPGTARTAAQFFKGGYREYLAGNYLRAMAQFETVLQMAPGHQLATIYKENCRKAIDDEVKFHLTQGKTGMASGKLKEARGHFESVLRILFRDTSRAEYNEARDQLAKVIRLIDGLEPEDIKPDKDAKKSDGGVN